MKKTLAVFILMTVLFVGTGIWFSPKIGQKMCSYYDNEVTGEIVGVCYNADDVRADFDGNESDMMAALEKIYAKPIKTVRTDDCVIVYAYSSRVAARPLETSEGERYNVMAACSVRGVSIGVPVLSGSY